MNELIHETVVTARKDHKCMACIYLIESGIVHDGVLSFSELREVVKAKRDGYKIKTNQKYVKQFTRFEGEVCTIKVRPKIHDICIKYDLYEI